MAMLRSIWGGLGHDLPPATVYWTLRCLMFILSFVLEDWALQELVHSTRQRRVAILLVASSYVTWTYQTHTFSNAIETLLVLWSLVLIGRIVEEKVHFLAMRTSFNNLQLVGTYRYLQMWCASVLERLRHLQPYHLSSLYPPTIFATSTAFSSETTCLLVACPLWRTDYILCRLCGHRVLHALSEKHPRHNILASHHTTQQSGVQLLPQQPITTWPPPSVPAYCN